MVGINLNKYVFHKYSSLRFFKEGESHVSRICPDNVIVLVYEGILRFSEDGNLYEIHPGEYFIQHSGGIQNAPLPSDAPKYFFSHFKACWDEESEYVLPKIGYFDYSKLKPIIEELDFMTHNAAPYILTAAKFYQILSMLYKTKPNESLGGKIADYISKECYNNITLEALCEKFHFSKNHIINIFKKEFGITPNAYAMQLKLSRAEYLIEVTSDSLESISLKCGFQNYSHFYRQFMRKNNISPEKFRNEKRK